MYDEAPVSSFRNKNTGTNLVMGAGGDYSSKTIIVNGKEMTVADVDTLRSIHALRILLLQQDHFASLLE